MFEYQADGVYTIVRAGSSPFLVLVTGVEDHWAIRAHGRDAILADFSVAKHWLRFKDNSRV